MKAAVFTGPYAFKICDREKPKPGPKEVLIRIRAVGICGSDIHPYMGDGIDRREPGIIIDVYKRQSVWRDNRTVGRFRGKDLVHNERRGCDSRDRW